jgi:hypothetical protein
MTIVLKFSISKDTITEIHRIIREIFRQAIEVFISTHFRIISIRIFKDRDNSIEILKNLISNSSLRSKLRELRVNSLMRREMLREQSCSRSKIFKRKHSKIRDKTNNFRNQKLIIRSNLREYTSKIMIFSMTRTEFRSLNKIHRHTMMTTIITRTNRTMKFWKLQLNQKICKAQNLIRKSQRHTLMRFWTKSWLRWLNHRNLRWNVVSARWNSIQTISCINIYSQINIRKNIVRL